MNELGKGMVQVTKNVCNIRFNKANNWVGQVGEYKGFCVFKNERYALRATWKLLRNYISQDDNTISKIITRFAPPCENNTEKYIKDVEALTFINKNKKLIGEIKELATIISAMSLIETGSNITPAFIAKAVNDLM